MLMLGSGWKSPVIAIALAIVSYGLIKGYSVYERHTGYVQGLESDNKTLNEENGVLTESVGSLKLAAEQQQEQVVFLQNELLARQKQQAEYQQRQVELEAQIAKLKKDSLNAIESITNEIKRAGLRNLRLPDAVIRMQRERAKEVNARAGSRDKSSQSSTAKADGLSTVPGS